MIPELGWPRYVWSTFARRWNCLVVGVCASKRRSAPFVRLCSARLPAIVHSSALDRRVFRRHPSQVINLSTDTIVPRSCSRCVLPWSGFVRFGLRGALPPKLSESRFSSRECVRHSFPQLFPLRLSSVPRGQRAPSTSSTASGRCSRIYPS